MSMTIRVAVEGFSMELKENGLGDDKHGKEMVQMKEKLALLILCHCKKPENKSDMDTLMKFDPKDEE